VVTAQQRAPRLDVAEAGIPHERAVAENPGIPVAFASAIHDRRHQRHRFQQPAPEAAPDGRLWCRGWGRLANRVWETTGSLPRRRWGDPIPSSPRQLCPDDLAHLAPERPPAASRRPLIGELLYLLGLGLDDPEQPVALGAKVVALIIQHRQLFAQYLDSLHDPAAVPGTRLTAGVKRRAREVLALQCVLTH
jgi:hypothetical protein